VDRAHGQPAAGLPEGLGNWNTVFKRFRHRVKADVLERIVDALSGDPDLEHAMLDGSIVKIHRSGQGAQKGTQGQALGRSRGGSTTRIVALTDARGNLLGFEPPPGHRFDTRGVGPLIEGATFGGLIADKAFDVDRIIADPDARDAEAVISQHPRRSQPRLIGAETYKRRHLIENFFGKPKEFKRIAPRGPARPTPASPR
jgi:transposase